MPTSAGAAGSGTAVGVSEHAQGAAAQSLLALGIALLILTAIFALAAVRGLLPRRQSRRQPCLPEGMKSP